MTKILTPASQSGIAREARLPVRPKSRGPITFKQRHPVSAFQSAGTISSDRTTESSSLVRVMDQNGERIRKLGIGSSGERRQIANRCGRMLRDRLFISTSFAGERI